MSTLNILRRSSTVMFCISVFVSCSFPSKNSNTNDKEIPKPVVDTINIVQMKFSPAGLAVHYGDTVMWTNNDMVAHDITDQKNKAWSSSSLAPGKSWKMVITKDEDYYCSIHQVMTGKIVLQ